MTSLPKTAFNRSRKFLLSASFLRFALAATLLAATGIAFFYAFENWRWAKAWTRVVEERKSRGLPTESSQVIPLIPPDAENFCALPLFMVQNPDRQKSGFPVHDPTGQSEDRPKSYAIWNPAYPNLTDWAAYYRRHAFYPQAGAEASDAEVVLAALSKFEPARQELLEAMKRPEAIFPVDYNIDPPTAIALPHIQNTMELAKYLSLHAHASLAGGQTEKAMEDLRLQFRIIEALSMEPLLISQLVNVVLTQYALKDIWSGLHRRQWSQKDLDSLNASLRNIDFLASGRRALEGEEIMFFFATMDRFKRTSGDELKLMFQMSGPSPAEPAWGPGYTLTATLMPVGWYDAAKIKASRWFQDCIDIADPAQHSIRPGNLPRREEVKEEFSLDLSNTLLQLALPSISDSWPKFAEAQCRTDMAIIACELESYRLKNGRYPKELAELSAVLPQDPISGKPYHYLMAPHGHYKLWCVGWNEKDDGGAPGYKVKDNRTPDPLQGDWVWDYPE